MSHVVCETRNTGPKREAGENNFVQRNNQHTCNCDAQRVLMKTRYPEKDERE